MNFRPQRVNFPLLSSRISIYLWLYSLCNIGWRRYHCKRTLAILSSVFVILVSPRCNTINHYVGLYHGHFFPIFLKALFLFFLLRSNPLPFVPFTTYQTQSLSYFSVGRPPLNRPARSKQYAVYTDIWLLCICRELRQEWQSWSAYQPTPQWQYAHYPSWLLCTLTVRIIPSLAVAVCTVPQWLICYIAVYISYQIWVCTLSRIWVCTLSRIWLCTPSRIWVCTLSRIWACTLSRIWVCTLAVRYGCVHEVRYGCVH
jgi:hypothetical protein